MEENKNIPNIEEEQKDFKDFDEENMDNIKEELEQMQKETSEDTDETSSEENLKVGDIVYEVNDLNYFIKVPFKVTYSKWLKSPDGVFKKDCKPFYYKQISFVRGSKNFMPILVLIIIIVVCMFAVLCLVSY